MDCKQVRLRRQTVKSKTGLVSDKAQHRPAGLLELTTSTCSKLYVTFVERSRQAEESNQ